MSVVLYCGNAKHQIVVSHHKVILYNACAPDPKWHQQVPLKQTHCEPKRNKRPAKPQKPANRRRCGLKSRRTERAAHRNRDKPSAPRTEITTNRTAHPSEAWGTKRRYLSKLSSLHTAGAPYQLIGKLCTCNQEKPKIKTGLCEPTVPTHQMRGSNGAGWAGKVPTTKTQNFPCRWENHEWTTTAQKNFS